MAQMKEENKTPVKELNKMKISNLSHAEFKTLVIRMLQEHIGYLNSIKKTQAEIKVALSEIKKNPQGTNSEGKEASVQINGLEHKDEINIQPEQKEEMRIQNNKESIRCLWDISKRTNI